MNLKIEKYKDYEIEINDEYEYILTALKDGKRVGLITFLKHPYLSKNGKDLYLMIDRIDVNEKERGFGLATKLYELSLKYLPKKYKGIASDLKNRVNKKEIPKIYSKFNNRIENWAGYEYHLIEKNNSNIKYKNGGNMETEYKVMFESRSGSGNVREVRVMAKNFNDAKKKGWVKSGLNKKFYAFLTAHEIKALGGLMLIQMASTGYTLNQIANDKTPFIYNIGGL
jgi:hypothetical protein